jgi:hypothetical protein
VTYTGPAPAQVYGTVLNPQGGVGVDRPIPLDNYSNHQLLQTKDTGMNTEGFYTNMNIPQDLIEQQSAVNARITISCPYKL